MAFKSVEELIRCLPVRSTMTVETSTVRADSDMKPGDWVRTIADYGVSDLQGRDICGVSKIYRLTPEQIARNPANREYRAVLSLMIGNREASRIVHNVNTLVTAEKITVDYFEKQRVLARIKWGGDRGFLR
jgi:hypothetical protein